MTVLLSSVKKALESHVARKKNYVLGLLFSHCCSIRLEKRELSKLINNRNKIRAVGCSYNWGKECTIAMARSLASECL